MLSNVIRACPWDKIAISPEFKSKRSSHAQSHT